MRRAFCLLVLLMLSAGALADYKNYAKGVEAAEKSEWDKVDQLIGASYASDRETKERARLYGQYFRPYIPQYYLALAAVKRNDCTSAMKYLNEAVYRAVIASGGKAAAEASQEATIRSRCATPVGNTSTTTTTPTAPTLSAAERDSANRAKQQLAQALSAARSAKVAAAELDPVARRAEQAAAAVDAALSKADPAQLSQAVNAVTSASGQLNALAEAARRTASASTATTSSAASTPAPPPPVTPPPPAKAVAASGLRTALATFLSGDYNGVLAIRATGMDATSAAHTCLLRAASTYSLFLLGAQADASLRAQAEAEVREARRNLSSIRANPRYFSPRFVEFFDRTR